MFLLLKNINILFKKRKIVDNFSLNIQKNDIFCLLGKNGSGKSTLMKAILGIIPYQGEIILNDKNLQYEKREDFLHQIGVLVEQTALYPHLSAKENLHILSLYYKNIPKNRIQEVLEIVGLQEEANKKTGIFSQGMKQRLGIAMAFLHNPTLILLDEPTNALDPEAIVQMRNLIRKLNQDMGCTFLINTHQIEEIEKLATNWAILKNGKLIHYQQDSENFVLTNSQISEDLQLKAKGFYTKNNLKFYLLAKEDTKNFESLHYTTPKNEDIFLALHQSIL